MNFFQSHFLLFVAWLALAAFTLFLVLNASQPVYVGLAAWFGGVLSHILYHDEVEKRLRLKRGKV